MMMLSIKTTLRSFLVVAVAFVSFTGYAQNIDKKPLRLFLIGNSFSQNATRYLPQLCQEGGHPLVIGRAEIGGAPLKKHWDSVVVSQQFPASRGKVYNGKSLTELLGNGSWDVVTIQQASVFSADSATYSPYAYNLYQLIKKLQPGAKVLMHQTWAYRSDARSFARKQDTVTTKSAEEMYRYSRAAYHTVAGYLGIGILPVGDAFWQATVHKKWGFKKMERGDEKNYTYPQLPDQTNSLNVGYYWDNNKKFGFDANHANDAGCYMGGLVWYAVLFNENPAKLKFKPESISEEKAAFLKKVAWKVVERLRKEN